MRQTLGPALPQDLCPARAEALARRLHALLAFRRHPRAPAALRIEANLLSHLSPGLPQDTFLSTPGAPLPSFAFPDDPTFHGRDLYPALADVRRQHLGGQDVLVLPGLVLALGDVPRAWSGEDPGPTDPGLLLPASPNDLSRLPKAPAGLAQALLALPPGPLLAAENASAHQRITISERLGTLAAPLARSARARRLQALDLLVAGPWRILVARITDRAGCPRTLPWALQHAP